VPRLRDVDDGQITLDGRDIRDITIASLRQLVAVVFEEPMLFTMSVRENLTIGRPNATDAEIHEALRVAHAGFVDRLPWVGTPASETKECRYQGDNGSGSRWPVPRYASDPWSSLDAHTETLVRKAIATALPQTTILTAARRPSTAAWADRVALLIDGRITATGPHARLMHAHAHYRALWRDRS
jgi:ATP-binding cassette, subfamily B, bacterial